MSQEISNSKPTLYLCSYCNDAFKTPCDGPLCDPVPITNYGPPVDDKCGTCGEWSPCVCVTGDRS